MDDLFRLLALRAPQPADSAVTVQIPPGQPTEFQQELARLRGPVSAATADGQGAPNAPAGTAARPPAPDAAAARHPQFAMWNAAAAFARSSGFLADPGYLALSAQLAAFQVSLTALPDPTTLAALGGAVQQSFNMSSTALVGTAEFAAAENGLGDALIAAKLSPAARLKAPDVYAGLLRLLAVIRRIAADDITLTAAGAIPAALAAHVLLPSSIFPVDPSMIQPMGIADDWVVREHISRYELGEIAQIENILQGELRKHASQHTLSTQQTLVIETTQTTETTKDLQTTDRFDLKTEVDNTLKEDISVKGGVSVKYSSTPVTVTANVDASYQRSKTDSSKVAADQSRDVVQRATTKVTSQVRQQQTTQIIETFSDDEEHTFDNTKGSRNVTGVYQWLNKVLRVQMFDLGPRAIFDVMVPEPAALLWDLKSQPDTTAPVPPLPFTADPSSLNAGTIGQYLTRYGVTGVPAPPAGNFTVSASYDGARKNDDDYNNGMVQAAVLNIPDGYQAQSAALSVVYVSQQDDLPNSSVSIEIGSNDVNFQDRRGTNTVNLSGEEGNLAVAVDTLKVDSYAVAIDVSCKLTAESLSAWQLKAHDAIMQAFLQQVKDYQDKVAAQQIQAAASDQVTGTNPDANRAVERTELKRQVIGLVAGPTIDLLGFNAVLENGQPPLDPRPDPVQAMSVGRTARFFEEALEWENMNYILYPYYWGRSKNWYQRVLAQDNDPLFADFLRAGQARVVIPVRKGFESDIQAFVDSGGQIWGGAPLPDVHSPDYLPIAKEIEATQNPDVGTPGTWWETTLPTNQLYLRADACLPTWHVNDQWQWTPDFTPCGKGQGGGSAAIAGSGAGGPS